MGETGNLVVRRFDSDDFDVVVERWHETNRTTYTYVAEHQRHTLADAQRFFAEHIVASCRILVASANGGPVGVMALRPPWIEQFAVFSGHRRRGVGTRLLEAARAYSPLELRAFTFQRNTAARTFYERNGFVAIAFGLSPAPELEPDVEYRWVA